MHAAYDDDTDAQAVAQEECHQKGSLEEFRAFYGTQLLAMWLGFRAERDITLAEFPHLFQYLHFDDFVKLAWRKS